MSRRYYISKIEVFEGSDGREAGVVARKYGTVVAQSIALDPSTGNPVHPYALVILEAENHGLAIADPECFAMPQFALDVKLTAMDTATKNNMVARLNAFGIDTSSFSTADGFRNIVRSMGQINNAAFDENLGSWQV